MTKLTFRHGPDEKTFDAEEIELHATIDGARIIWTEHEAVEVVWEAKKERTPA